QGSALMPEFQYKAANRSGSVEEGRIAASSEQMALRQLRERGLTPVRLQAAEGLAAAGLPMATPAAGATRRSRGGDRLGRAEVQALTTELAVLLRAGLPIDRALKIQIEMCSGNRLRQLLQGLLDTVKGGKPFSHGLEGHPELFSAFYVNIVRSGEPRGRLAEVL